MVEAGSVGDVVREVEVYGVTSHLARNQYSRGMGPFPHAALYGCI